MYLTLQGDIPIDLFATETLFPAQYNTTTCEYDFTAYINIDIQEELRIAEFAAEIEQGYTIYCIDVMTIPPYGEIVIDCFLSINLPPLKYAVLTHHSFNEGRPWAIENQIITGNNWEDGNNWEEIYCKIINYSDKEVKITYSAPLAKLVFQNYILYDPIEYTLQTRKRG